MTRRTLITAAALLVLVAAAFTLAGCRQMCKRCGHTVKVTVLEGVNFDFNKATLKPAGKAILDNDVKLLADDKTLDVAIEGHCDIVGSDEYNQKLSEARAKAVMDFLVGKGVDAGRLAAKGYGMDKPIAPNTTDEGRAKNRRVVLSRLD